jgi:hypothetical protein
MRTTLIVSVASSQICFYHEPDKSPPSLHRIKHGAVERRLRARVRDGERESLSSKALQHGGAGSAARGGGTMALSQARQRDRRIP